MTDDDAEPMKIDCQKLLSVNLQNSTIAEGRGPGRMPMWHRNTSLKVLKIIFLLLYFINIIIINTFMYYLFRKVIEKFVEVYAEFGQLNLVSLL